MKDCWNTIGVYGDSSCMELEKHTHCYNCPVYSDAAKELFDRSRTIDGTQHLRSHDEDPSNGWAAALEESKKASRNTQSVAIFRIGPHWMALLSIHVREVVDPRKVRAIPHRSNELLLGLVNIKGTLHLCVSLKSILELSDKEDGQETKRSIYPRMMLIEDDGKSWAFHVDELHSLHRYAPEALIPLTDEKKASKGILEFEGRTVDLLDEIVLYRKLERSLV